MSSSRALRHDARRLIHFYFRIPQKTSSFTYEWSAKSLSPSDIAGG
jgi:hypothetical protein